MKDYPKLAEMGVTNPVQIKQFLVNGILNYDVLRIVYERKKGSLLPASRIYKFPRVQRSVAVDGSTEKTATVLETDPSLRAALAELQDLLGVKEQKQDMAESVLQELALLQEDVALRSGRIEELVKRI